MKNRKMSDKEMREYYKQREEGNKEINQMFFQSFINGLQDLEKDEQCKTEEK